ncbi:MAG: UDP-2,3-diacylglucosamine diphosphatase LpxI, partial [Caulobacteraceae bacterium]|nr:UDP-2,3-diacylglucosamine diphosphatase LpxI [Caulobacteraceae bacterium]
DLPTIGAETVIAAHRAGLAGIVGEAGALLVVDRASVIEMADELGLFVVGLPAEPTAQPKP